jgi:hypothetical protein
VCVCESSLCELQKKAEHGEHKFYSIYEIYQFIVCIKCRDVTSSGERKRGEFYYRILN